MKSAVLTSDCQTSRRCGVQCPWSGDRKDKNTTGKYSRATE